MTSRLAWRLTCRLTCQRLFASCALLAAVTIAVLVAPFASIARAQSRPGAGGGVGREQMWYAPTEADWKKPVLITFQRTWEDAVAVSKETGKAILICVNMDGEIASEHYAGVRYRQPDRAALYEPYVCVIASTYRHTPRDYDDQGRRILCPRFGSVTCGEHITIEPILYEKYFEGQRIAPRHIMVELDGKETYDVFYAFDTDSVFKAIEDGIANRTAPAPTVVRGDRPILERVASHDVRDRDAVEGAYEGGDKQLRGALLDAAAKHADVASPDLLRLAIYGFDTDMTKKARQALVQSKSEAAVDLIPEALRVPMEPSEREALVGALQRIGASSSSPRARWLSVVHQGLATPSSTVDVDGWSNALAGSRYAAPADNGGWTAVEDRLDDIAAQSQARPEDAQARLALAEAAIDFAKEAASAFEHIPESGDLLATDPRTARRMALSRYQEALTGALEAEKLGATGWRTNRAVAIAAYYLGDTATAFARAEAAVKEMPSGQTDWNAMAVLTIFAEGRFKAIKAAVAEGNEWPPQWLTDVHSAYTVLLHHPMGTADQVVWHYDFLSWLGVKDRASRFLSQGIERYPAAAVLHDRLRTAILDEKGASALEPAYEAMLRKPEPPASLVWFAGLASFVAAEYHRRSGMVDEAIAAYGRAIESYDRAATADPESREASDFNVALALAGRARIAFERSEYDKALADILASFARDPQAAGTLDGLNITPAMTAQSLLANLAQAERAEDATKLRTALQALDPEHLAEPFSR